MMVALKKVMSHDMLIVNLNDYEGRYDGWLDGCSEINDVSEVDSIVEIKDRLMMYKQQIQYIIEFYHMYYIYIYLLYLLSKMNKK